MSIFLTHEMLLITLWLYTYSFCGVCSRKMCAIYNVMLCRVGGIRVYVAVKCVPYTTSPIMVSY